MTGFLASVRSLEEAEIAIAGGVDIIDLKEPQNGALGAVPFSVMTNVVNRINGEKLVSATVGDLPCDKNVICPVVQKIAETGVDLIKVGLFQAPADDLLLQIGQQATQGVIIVLFGDRFSPPTIENLVEEVADAGLAGIMLDTANKTVGSLRHVMQDSVIQQFVIQARERELITGLAGSLTEHDIFALSHLEPDYLGFRGALCTEHDRISSLSADCVKHIRNLIIEEEEHYGEVA